jgi:hypothetical protein
LNELNFTKKKMATAPIKSRTTPEFVCGTEILGTGGFGTAFKGKFGGKPVAVKSVPRANLTVKKEGSMRKQQSMMKLNHRNNGSFADTEFLKRPWRTPTLPNLLSTTFVSPN